MLRDIANTLPTQLRSTPPMLTVPSLPLFTLSMLNFNTPEIGVAQDTAFLTLGAPQKREASQFDKTQSTFMPSNSPLQETHFAICIASSTTITSPLETLLFISFYMDHKIAKGIILYLTEPSPKKTSIPQTHLPMTLGSTKRHHTLQENNTAQDKRNHNVKISDQLRWYKCKVFSKRMPLLLRISTINIFPQNYNQRKASTLGGANHL